MKKTIALLFTLALAFALSAPLQTFACTSNDQCGSGETCNLQGICVNNSNVLNSTGSSGGGSGTLGADIQSLIQFLNGSIVPLIFAVAFIVFLWGIFQYFIAGAGNEEKREQGRTFIMYGLIGFVVMLSIWGIVNLFYHSLGFDSQTRPNLPTF